MSNASVINITTMNNYEYMLRFQRQLRCQQTKEHQVRLQRALCLLKLLGPLRPFCVQPHLHAAVTLQQSVACSAKGR